MHCTAGGKLYLSSLPAERRAKLIAELGLEKRTANTITDPRRLEEAVRQVADEETGVDEEEFIDGMIAVSVPVKDEAGRMVASLAMHAPVFRMTLQEAKAHRSEEHTSELQSLMRISYAVFCLKKKITVQ